MNTRLPIASAGKRPLGKTTRVSASMTEEEKEILDALASTNRANRSEIIRLALQNQHFLQTLVNEGGTIVVTTSDGKQYEFRP